MDAQPRLYVLSGPSGVGKGSVVKHIQENYPDVWISVSVTTRPPRPGERHGTDYYFFSNDEYDRMVDAKEFLEHKTYAGKRYGTPRGPVKEQLATGRSALLEIDVEGAKEVRVAFPDATLVFLAPPTWEELEARLRGRETETPSEIAKRLELAREEMAAEDEFDVVITNHHVEEAAAELVALLKLSQIPQVNDRENSLIRPPEPPAPALSPASVRSVARRQHR